MKISFCCLFMFFIQQPLSSQSKYILTGTVRDASTNEPLVHAMILVEGTTLGTTSDDKGTFSLPMTAGEYVVRCSYVGYKTVEIPISVDKDIRIAISLFTMDVLLQDVTVYAYRKNGGELVHESALSLQSEKIKTSTSIIPDVLRSVQMLPGVSTNNEFSAKFNVRGGNQDENLVLVNGTQVYDPYHLKEVPNASIGFMNMEMISTMDLMTGGFPARYGDKMSSVVDIEYREGDKDRYKAIASLSLTDVDVVVEGPLSEKGSFILGARKSYLEYILKLMSNKTSIHPSFYDVQGVASYSLSPGHTLLFKFFHAGDDFAQDPTIHQGGPYQQYLYDGWTSKQQWRDSVDMHSQYTSTLLSLQSIDILSASTILKTELSFYDQIENERYFFYRVYQNQFERGGQLPFFHTYSVQLYHNTLRVRTLELNLTLDRQISSLYGIKTGLSYQRITYEQDQTFQRTIDKWYNNTSFYPDTTFTHQIENPLDFIDNLLNARSLKCAGFIENVVQLSDQFLLNVGGRFDYFDLNKDLRWSPRIQLAYQIREGLTLRSAWGYYHQSPNYRQIAYSTASDTNTQSQRAIHYVLGVDYAATLDPEERNLFKLKVECFYKRYDNLMSAILTSDGYLYYSRHNDAVGDSKGLDIYMMYSMPGFYGWVSYGYLTSVQNVLDDVYGSFPRNTDQRHTLAAVGEWGLGSQWNMNMRFVYGSGYPYTPLSASYNSTSNNWEWISGVPHSLRLPAYRRLDLRITKSFWIFGLTASVFLDVNNVLNAHNIQSYRYTFDDYGQPTKKEVDLWPLIPSFGISVRF